jgi:hypothetical protein
MLIIKYSLFRNYQEFSTIVANEIWRVLHWLNAFCKCGVFFSVRWVSSSTKNAHVVGVFVVLFLRQWIGSEVDWIVWGGCRKWWLIDTEVDRLCHDSFRSFQNSSVIWN